MNGSEATLWTLAGIGVIILVWCAQQQTGDGIPVPEVQSETQVMGLGVGANMRFNVGTPLEISQAHHGWHPGYDPDPHAVPVYQSPHRYPALPGGNISTVMHKGWSRMSLDSPSGNDWRINPPEAAVI